MRGTGFVANVPAGWTIERLPRTLAAARPDGPEAVSISVFRLSKPVTDERWPAAVRELNDVAARLAERIAPTARVVSSRDDRVGERRARLYEIRYVREGEELRDRVAFVLVGTREYQLTCRVRVASPAVGDDACGELLSSFRPRA